MAIKVACQCGKRFAAPPHLAGKKVPCPSCGSTIVIAAATARGTPPQVASAPAAAGSLLDPQSQGPGQESDLWNDLPAQTSLSAPQPAGPPPQPYPQQSYAQPSYSQPHLGWNSPAPQNPQPSLQSSIAHQYLANAHGTIAEEKRESAAWTNGQIYSGALLMAFAALWFCTGLAFGIIFFLPPILFISGLIALINGISYKLNQQRMS